MPSLPAELQTLEACPTAGFVVALAALLSATPAQAQPHTEPRATALADRGLDDEWILQSGRQKPPPADPTGLVVSLHGEYQIRYRVQSDLRLQAPDGLPDATELGQTHYVYHWLRLNPRLRYRDDVQVVGQVDVPRGLVVGDTTRLVDRARDALDRERWYEVHPRYLYVEWSSPVAVFRLGQQGAHWGMGLLVNDGDHPSLFGDTARGSLVERVSLATMPFGVDTPLTVVLAGDVVFEDGAADLIDGDDPGPGQAGKVGDRALQGVLAAIWRTDRGELGLYGSVRSRDRSKETVDPLVRASERQDVGTLDVTGKLHAPVPGSRALLYGQLEWAYAFGTTRSVERVYSASFDAQGQAEERLRAFGVAATLGAVNVSAGGADRFGELVAEIEWGWASGDADPMDDTAERFTFDPNHNVGLVLFDQVLAWKTARAATLAHDDRTLSRRELGLRPAPSNGGVFGATYINPRIVYRPKPFLDLKGGAVVAQTTADIVDPYHVGVRGLYAGYDGGDARSRDLGLELDLGVEARVQADRSTTVQIGAEGGVLFPGHAFDSASGQSLDNQYVGAVKLGLQY